MIITKKHLSRRTFIRGTFGAAMALPLLDAMVPALTAQSKTAAGAPFRFGAIWPPSGQSNAPNVSSIAMAHRMICCLLSPTAVITVFDPRKIVLTRSYWIWVVS